MNLNQLLPIAQIDTSYAEEHERTYSSWFDSAYWFPEQASEFAHRSDYLFMAISYIALFFFIIICIVMFVFVWKYRRRPGHEPQPSPSHHTGLEIFWSVIPSIILAWIFFEGASGYFDMRVPTDDAEEIYVTASRWNWQFRYPNGDMSSELHLVNDKPVKLIMQSTDVLHSMFISAFRQKMDIVPGRYTYAYLKPTMIGKFRLSCTEYCGKEHSRMRTLCQVHPDEETRRTSTEWIRAEHKPWENGERLYKMNCSGCHKIDGQAATGPALNLLWAKGQEELIDGTKVDVTEEYIRESILYPEKAVVAGYGPVSKMNSFEGKLTPDQIIDLTVYIKYLSDPQKYDIEYETADDGTTLVVPSTNGSSSPEANKDDAAEETSDEEATKSDEENNNEESN